MSDREVAKRIAAVNRTKIAGELGVDRGHLSGILTGRSVPSLELAGKIAGKLGITIDQLVACLKAMQGKRTKSSTAA